MKFRNIFNKPGGTLPTAAISALCVAFILLASAMTASGETKDKVPAGSRTVVTAAGATFPLPFYNEAFKAYWQRNSVPVTYAGIGSSKGMESLRNLQTDFVGIDVPPTREQLDSLPAQAVVVPMCVGAVEIAYNLEGVDNLRLTGELLADIYLGELTRWNDPRIAAVNPGKQLPDKEIYPIFRLDGSGTTYAFTYYLSQTSGEWKSSVGTGMHPQFPHGVAATGTPGIATLIEKIPGAIGYASSGYSVAYNLQRAEIQNTAGNFMLPTAESIAAAAREASATNIMITNSTAPEAYPISCFSWVMLYKEQNYAGRSRGEAEATVRVLRWLAGPEAQAIASRLNYAPLPTEVAAKALETLDKVTYKGRKIE